MPAEHHGPQPASPWVRRFVGLVAPGGAVLDVACGTGRHARLFLDRGHPVVAVDRYNAGIVDLLGRADFEFVDADLEDGGKWPLGGREFAAATTFLPSFPALLAARDIVCAVCRD